VVDAYAAVGNSPTAEAAHKLPLKNPQLRCKRQTVFVWGKNTLRSLNFLLNVLGVFILSSLLAQVSL